MSSEKRKNNRHNVFLNPVSCFKSGSSRTSVDISDISPDGIGIVIDQRLTKGDRIELEVLIPGDDIPMFVKGEIAWITRQKASESSYSAGVRLNKFHQHDKNRLIKYLQSNITY